MAFTSKKTLFVNYFKTLTWNLSDVVSKSNTSISHTYLSVIMWRKLGINFFLQTRIFPLSNSQLKQVCYRNSGFRNTISSPVRCFKSSLDRNCLALSSKCSAQVSPLLKNLSSSRYKNCFSCRPYGTKSSQSAQVTSILKNMSALQVKRSTRKRELKDSHEDKVMSFLKQVLS